MAFHFFEPEGVWSVHVAAYANDAGTSKKVEQRGAARILRYKSDRMQPNQPMIRDIWRIPMPKNIVVFSDGTGQDGGARPEQRTSNVYKLYKASQIGYSNDIHPSEQVIPDLTERDSVALPESATI